MMLKLNIDEELWDLNLPTTPPRSHLFHLPPIGIATPDVESITSYVARLAIAHSVPPGILLAIDLGPLVKPNYQKTCSIVVVYAQKTIRALNGTHFVASQLVKALEAQTLQDNLHFLTMLPYSQVFPSLGLLKANQSWCPMCYQKWREQELVIYSPLLWALQVVTVCPYHHQPLQSQCPYCHASFIPLWRNTQPGYCLKCGSWLGACTSHQHITEDDKSKFNWEIWVAHTLGELISQTPRLKLNLPRETIKNALAAYLQDYFNGNISDFQNIIGVPDFSIYQWLKGKTIPRLEQLLQICYGIKINLVDFLQSKFTPLKEEITSSQNFSTYKSTTNVQSITKSNYYQKNEILLVMQQALTEYPPPSLEEVALRAGCSGCEQLYIYDEKLPSTICLRYLQYQQLNSLERVRSLLQSVLDSESKPPLSVREITRRYHIGPSTCYRYGSDLCQAISLRYENYKKQLQKQAIETGISEVRQLAPELYAQGINPTAKKIRHFMKNPSTLWHKEVIEALNEIRRELDD